MEPLLLKDFLGLQIPKIEYLVDSILPKGNTTMLFGPPGTGKSTLSMYLALQGANGAKCLNFGVKQKFRTLYLDEENGVIGLHDKLQCLIKGTAYDNLSYQDEIAINTESGFRFIAPSEIVRLNEIVTEFNPNLIIFDSLTSMFPLEENNVNDVKKLFTDIKHFTKRGIAVLLIHHSRKKNFGQLTIELEDIAGSRYFSASIASALVLDEFSKGNYVLSHVKSRYGIKSEPINFVMNGRDSDYISIGYKGTATECIKEHTEHMQDIIEREIIKWIEEDSITDFVTSEVMSIMKSKNFKQTNVEVALRSLIKSGLIEKDKRGHYVRK